MPVCVECNFYTRNGNSCIDYEPLSFSISHLFSTYSGTWKEERIFRPKIGIIETQQSWREEQAARSPTALYNLWMTIVGRISSIHSRSKCCLAWHLGSNYKKSKNHIGRIDVKEKERRRRPAITPFQGCIPNLGWRGSPQLTARRSTWDDDEDGDGDDDASCNRLWNANYVDWATPSTLRSRPSWFYAPHLMLPRDNQRDTTMAGPQQVIFLILIPRDDITKMCHMRLIQRENKIDRFINAHSNRLHLLHDDAWWW